MALCFLQLGSPPEVQVGGPYLPARMERELRQAKALADDRLWVALEDDSIVLRGRVDSLAERRLAEAIVGEHKPARLRIDNRLEIEGVPVSASGALRELAALARLGKARSHAQEIRNLADRVLVEAELVLSRIAPGATPQPARPSPDERRLAHLSGNTFNRAYIAALAQQLSAALAALERTADARPARPDLDSAIRELRGDRDQAAMLQELYERPPPRRPPR